MLLLLQAAMAAGVAGTCYCPLRSLWIGLMDRLCVTELQGAAERRKTSGAAAAQGKAGLGRPEAAPRSIEAGWFGREASRLTM